MDVGRGSGYDASGAVARGSAVGEGSSAACSFILRCFAAPNGPSLYAANVLTFNGCSTLRNVYKIAHNRESLNATGLEADDRSGSGS